jgi:hypothetical protein
MARVRVLPLAFILLIFAAAGCSRRADRIEISPTKVKIYGLDRTQRLSAKILDKKGRPLEIGTANWESSNNDIATVDAGGLVTPKAEGQTRIIAKYEKVRAEIPIEIIDVKSLEITPTTVQLVGPAGVAVPVQASVKNSKDKPVALTPMWSSGNTAIATISADGLVTSVAKGTTTIVARVGDVQGVCEVIVDIRNLSKIEIRPQTALVHVGDSQHFQVIAYDVDGRPIEGPAAVFKSSDPATASVTAGGSASGMKAGAATIKASIGTLTTEATLIVN